MRRAAVGLGRAHLRCHEEDAQQTFRESDGDRGARLAGMSARMRSPWGPDHHVHSKLGAHLHLVVVSILVKKVSVQSWGSRNTVFCFLSLFEYMIRFQG